MFTDYNGHHGPIHHGPPGHHPHHQGGHMPQHHMPPPPQAYNPYMRPRMDATSDVFTCLFGDLFVKWWVRSGSTRISSGSVHFLHLGVHILVLDPPVFIIDVHLTYIGNGFVDFQYRWAANILVFGSASFDYRRFSSPPVTIDNTCIGSWTTHFHASIRYSALVLVLIRIFYHRFGLTLIFDSPSFFYFRWAPIVALDPPISSYHHPNLRDKFLVLIKNTSIGLNGTLTTGSMSKSLEILMLFAAPDWFFRLPQL